MDHGPPATLLPFSTPTTPAICPPLGIGLLSPWRSAPCRCLTVTSAPRMCTTPLSCPLRLAREWRLIRNPKLTSPLAPLRRRRILSIVADAPQPSAVLLGPAPRQFPCTIQISRLDLSMVILNPAEDIVTLVRRRCPETHRPHHLPAKVHPDIAAGPIRPGHLRPRLREIRPPSLRNTVAHRDTAAVCAIHPPTVVLHVLPARAPRPRLRRGTLFRRQNWRGQ